MSYLSWHPGIRNLAQSLSKEILVALKESNPSKAPKSDGLNAGWIYDM